jgi:hypothetical protein
MLIKKIKGYLVIAALYLFTFTTAYSQTTQCILNVKNDRAYFHDRTALNGKVSFTQRKAFLVLGDQVAINCQDKNEKWIYVSYKNSKGTITRGYIKKADLENAQTNNLSTKEILSKLDLLEQMHYMTTRKKMENGQPQVLLLTLERERDIKLLFLPKIYLV